MTGHAAPLSMLDVSDAVYSLDIPAERPWSRVLAQGQTLRIIDSEGQQAVDALLYCAADPTERYSSQDTLRVQGSAYVELGTRLVSNKGNVMARITGDSCGRHDTSAGCCSCESNAVRFGEATKYQHACRENFILELSKHGLTKRDIVANLNILYECADRPVRKIHRRRWHLSSWKLRRRYSGHGRAFRYFQLSPGQQSLQWLQSNSGTRGDLGCQKGVSQAINSAVQLDAIRYPDQERRLVGQARSLRSRDIRRSFCRHRPNVDLVSAHVDT